jgi:putative transposase
MPSRNILKQYKDKSFYHVYNRGVEKRSIFIDDLDFRVLLYCFKIYLSPPSFLKQYSLEKVKEMDYIRLQIINYAQSNSFYEKIQLHYYLLMPNHFHFILKQEDSRDLPSFMRTIFTKYTKYFNKRYTRIGPLFQSRYKGTLIANDQYLLQLIKYINHNPSKLKSINFPNYKAWTCWQDYPYSSYHHYVSGSTPPVWLTTKFVLKLAKGRSNFIKYNQKDKKDKNINNIKNYLLE